MSKIAKVNLTCQNNDAFEYIYAICNFCGKKMFYSHEEYNDSLKLGHNKHFCNFCLRHQFTPNKKGNILILNFRASIGFLIYYVYSESKQWWNHHTLKSIKQHILTGNQHPLFIYDEESMNWFIDFNRIGKGKHQLPLESITDHVYAILESMQLNQLPVAPINIQRLHDKYETAMHIFYESKQRPTDKRILAPTPLGCTSARVDDWEALKDFSLTNVDESLIPTTNYVTEVETLTADLQQPTIDAIDVEVKYKKNKHESGWEGIISLPGCGKTKITTKTGKYIFDKKSTVNSLAKKAANRLGVQLNLIGKHK